VASVQPSGIDLYRLPLGAGGHSVRFNGLVFEAIAVRLQHRGRSDRARGATDRDGFATPRAARLHVPVRSERLGEQQVERSMYGQM
jgi:hypothetical protein